MSRVSTQRGKTRGFTLIELMCSLVVLLVGVLSAFATGLTSLNVVKTGNDTITAVSDLQACMEQVLILPHDDIDDSYPNPTPIAAYSGLHLRNQLIVPSYPDGPTADPLVIRLTCTWTDWAGRNRTVTLSSTKAR